MTSFNRFSRLFCLVIGLSAAAVGQTAWADDASDVQTLIRAGQMPQALVKVEQSLTSKPRDPQLRFLKGVIQTEQGKPNDAIATFVKLTEDFPELPEPYNNLAVLYASQSQLDKARAALEMAIRTNPSYATAHENLGDVYAKLASQAYSKALQLDGATAPAVQPKLALIRDLFAPGAKAVVTTAPPPVATKPAPTPPVVATKPAVTPPTPVATPATPVVNTPAAPAANNPAVAANSEAEKEVEGAVRQWAAAWAAKDMNDYFAAYGKDFDPSGGQSRKAWEEDRRRRIEGKSRISVKLQDVKVSINGKRATVRFKQDYRADSLAVSSRKTLDMVKVGDRWVIVKESTGS